MKGTGTDVKQFAHESHSTRKRNRKKKLTLIDELQLSEHSIEFITDKQSNDYKVSCALKYQYFLDKDNVYFVRLSYGDKSSYIGVIHVFRPQPNAVFTTEGVWVSQKGNTNIKRGDVLLKTVTPKVMSEAMKQINVAA